MTSKKEIPLFPLNTVLFPGMILPLHIFEPRYKLMISECLRTNSPFGVVLIREGEEVGDETTEPYEYGTSAYITQVDQLEDGRMNIKSVGYQRFKIHEIRRDKPYQVGIVEATPLAGQDDPQAEEIARRVSERLREYLDMLQAISETALSLDDIPEDGSALAFLTAILLPIQTAEKQILLESADLTSMLGQQEHMLRREIMFLERRLIQDQRGLSDLLFSIN